MATNKADDVSSRKELKKVPDKLTKIRHPMQEEQDGFDIWREEANKRLEEEEERFRREQASLAPENQKTEEQLKNGKPRFVFKKLETSIQQQMLNNIIEYESAWEGRAQCRFMHCVTETCQHCDRERREDKERGKPDTRFLAYQEKVVGTSKEMTAMKHDPEKDDFFDEC